jgi:hypothetical protein
MSKASPRSEQSISIRFPPDVLDALRKIAQASGRSFNGEVIWALRDYVERTGGGSMETYDRAKTIQVPGTASGDDSVVCGACGTPLLLRAAFLVNIERADIPTGGLLHTSRVFACSAEHAQALLSERRPGAPRIPTPGAPYAR